MLDDTEIQGFLRSDYPRIVNAVAFVSGDRQGAEDAVQEALVRAWMRSERGETIDSLPNWVTAVALNLTRSVRRRVLLERRVRARAPQGTASEMEDAGDRVDIVRALRSLPRRQREVAVLRLFLQMSTAEVAAALGVSGGTVKSSFAAARTSLVASLRIEDEERNDVKG